MCLKINYDHSSFLTMEVFLKVENCCVSKVKMIQIYIISYDYLKKYKRLPNFSEIIIQLENPEHLNKPPTWAWKDFHALNIYHLCDIFQIQGHTEKTVPTPNKLEDGPLKELPPAV